MSVLIKGMEMPESCFYCEFCCEVYRGGSVKLKCERLDKYIENNPYRMIDCPLVEIPTEQRGLIDADRMDLQSELFTFTRYTGIDEAPLEDATSIIDKAPTVVPAEKGGAE